MVKPTIDELSKNKYNRYTLVIATAKSARYIAAKQREERDAELNAQDKYKSSMSEKSPTFLSDKPVKIAIQKLCDGDFQIVDAPEKTEDDTTKQGE